MKKIILFALTLIAATCMLAISISAAEWFSKVEYLEGIKVTDHIRTPVTEETPELGEPTEAARVKLSCTCAAGEHTFPAYYIAHKESGNSEMWNFNFNDVNAKLTCGGEEMGLKNLIAYEFPNGISTICCTLYYECKEMNLKYLSFERAATLKKMGSTLAGKNWFANSSIEEVRFGSSIENIAPWFFHNCKSLKTVVFGENSKITTIGQLAFYKNTSLTEMILPDSVSHLDSSVFKDCVNIGAFYISSALTQFGVSNSSNNSPIDGCKNLYFINDRNDTAKPSVYYFPATIQKIVGEAFKGCTNLNDVIVFPKGGVTSIDNGWAFCNSNAISIVFLEDMENVASVSNQAWNSGITLYFCNPKDLSVSDIVTYAGCKKVFCFAEGNETHLKELTKGTDATCTLPKMVADYCFCGAIMGEPQKDGEALGHNYTGATQYTFTTANKEGTKCTICVNGCGIDEITVIPPVYVELGYSAKTFGTAQYSFTNGYEINRESLALYEKEKGVTLKFGFAFNLAQGFTSEEVTLDSFAVKANVVNQTSDINFKVHEFVVNYGNGDNLNAEIIIGAFVIENDGENDNLYFINRSDDTSIGTNGFEAVSYNFIKETYGE